MRGCLGRSLPGEDGDCRRRAAGEPHCRQGTATHLGRGRLGSSGWQEMPQLLGRTEPGFPARHTARHLLKTSLQCVLPHPASPKRASEQGGAAGSRHKDTAAVVKHAGLEEKWCLREEEEEEGCQPTAALISRDGGERLFGFRSGGRRNPAGRRQERGGEQPLPGEAGVQPSASGVIFWQRS